MSRLSGGIRAYFANYWNWLDFVVAVSSAVLDIMYISGSGNEASGVAALRMMRVLRPLRALTHIHTLKVVVLALVDSGKVCVRHRPSPQSLTFTRSRLYRPNLNQMPGTGVHYAVVLFYTLLL